MDFSKYQLQKVPNSKANEDKDMMTALEEIVVQRFKISNLAIFETWKNFKGVHWNRNVKDTKRHLIDHWASIALTPSCEYTQFAIIGFTASTNERASFLDSIQSYRILPRFWVGHESSVYEEISPPQKILWKTLDSTSWTPHPGALSVLLDHLRKLENIDGHISAIIAKYSEICEIHNLKTLDMKSFLDEDSRFNESYCDAVIFFKLQLETIGKVGFVEFLIIVKKLFISKVFSLCVESSLRSHTLLYLAMIREMCSSINIL
jgi:hypothetical protein